MRLSVPESPPEVDPPRVTAEDIAEAVVQARGSMAVFDSGSRVGPKDMRPLCSRIASGMSDLLGSVGL